MDRRNFLTSSLALPALTLEQTLEAHAATPRDGDTPATFVGETARRGGEAKGDDGQQSAVVRNLLRANSVHDARTALNPVAAFHGDATTQDDDNFRALEAQISNQIVDLGGRSYAVSAVPKGNRYRNGTWVVGGIALEAEQNDGMISSINDTGILPGSIYKSPATGLLSLGGRTTRHLFGLLWAQNSVAKGPARAGVIASIYSWATGNVSAVLAARQSGAMVPQSVVVASEESAVIHGFRAFMAACISSRSSAETAFLAAARRCWAGAMHTFNLASVDAVAGGGSGMEVRCTPVGGRIDAASLVIVAGGKNYAAGGVLVFADRKGDPKNKASAKPVFDVKGTLTGFRDVVAGAGYSDTVDVYYIDEAGHYSGNIATANFCETAGSNSVNIASQRARTTRTAIFGVNIGQGGSAGSTAGAPSAGNYSGRDNEASGESSATLASASGVARGTQSLVLAASLCQSLAEGSVVWGRRTINAVARSFAWGDCTRGPASTANRKGHFYADGNVEIAGTLVQNRVFSDIAKMFENEVAGVEIPIGALVTLDGRKVRLARDGDDFFSVHSRTYAVLLGDSGFTWAGRYLYDEYGVPITEDIPDPDWSPTIDDPSWPRLVANPDHPRIESLLDEQGSPICDADGRKIRACVSEPLIANPIPPRKIPNPEPRRTVTVPKENPAFDPAREQIARSKRNAEWTPVLLQGEAFAHVTDDVRANDHIRPVAPGLGGRSDRPTRFRCMEITSPFDAARGHAIALVLRV